MIGIKKIKGIDLNNVEELKDLINCIKKNNENLEKEDVPFLVSDDLEYLLNKLQQDANNS